MKIYFFLLVVVFTCSCQSETVSDNAVYISEKIVDNTNVTKINEKNNDEDVITTKNLKCGSKDFALVVKYEDDDSKSVNIKEGETMVKKIILPRQDDVNGFSMNWAKENSKGFEISIDYGSRFYYEKIFNFVCEQGKFSLSNVKIVTFDKHNPENSGEEFNKVFKTKLPLEKFLINDFIGND